MEGTPGIAATVAFTSATIFSTTSGFADAIASDTVTPAYATSISLMIPNDTMSRVKPGYFTFLSSARISLGLGMRLRYQNARLMLSFPNRRKNDGSNARIQLINSAHCGQVLRLAERRRTPGDIYAVVPAHPAQRRVFEGYRELVQHLRWVAVRVERLDRDRETWQFEVLARRKAIVLTAEIATSLRRKESVRKTYSQRARPDARDLELTSRGERAHVAGHRQILQPVHGP